jgi:hypothetical protein
MQKVELLGRLGERVDEVEIPFEPVDIIAHGSRHFVRDEDLFYPGLKYVEATVLRIELRKEDARGTAADRKATAA